MLLLVFRVLLAHLHYRPSINRVFLYSYAYLPYYCTPMPTRPTMPTCPTMPTMRTISNTIIKHQPRLPILL